MTLLATRPLGPPRSASLRGGDCRARDLDAERNVYGPHVFASSTHVRITNGLVRFDVGVTGATPTITLSIFTGSFVTDDFLSDILSDTLEGSITPGSWVAMGSITFDSPSVTALLTGARLVRITPEAVILRLIVPAVADVFLTLRRGERMVRIQHGSNRAPTVTTTRRVTWTAAAPGTATSGLVVETTPDTAGFPRFLAALPAVTTDGAAFSMTTASVRSAAFATGVATADFLDTPADMHAQLAAQTRQDVVIG